jgi:hypothetical protein
VNTPIRDPRALLAIAALGTFCGLSGSLSACVVEHAFEHAVHLAPATIPAWQPPARPEKMTLRRHRCGRFVCVAFELPRTDQLLPADALPVLADVYRRAADATVVHLIRAGEFELVRAAPHLAVEGEFLAATRRIDREEELRALFHLLAEILETESEGVIDWAHAGATTADAYAERSSLLPSVIIVWGESGEFRLECDLQAGVAIAEARGRWSAYEVSPAAMAALARLAFAVP